MNIDIPLRQHLAELPLTPEVVASMLADRCRHSPELAEQLRQDIHGYLEKTCDIKLPEGVRLVIHDNTDDTWHLPLPSYSQGGEISEEQMEKITAGETIPAFVVVISLAVGLTALFGSLAAAGKLS